MICSFCHSQISSKPLHVNSTVTGKTVNYYPCSVCKSLHQFPIPGTDALSDYYKQYEAIKSRMNPGYLAEEQYQLLAVERTKTLREIGFDTMRFSNGNHVELGCATGHFLRFLQVQGASEITGLDISEELLAKIKLAGVRLICGGLDQLESSSVDTLYMFNILEHLPDPELTLETAVSILKPKGTLVLEVPLSGLVSSFFKSKWRFLMPDEHLHLPSLQGLKTMLDRFNISIKGVIRFGSGFTTGILPMPIKGLFDQITKSWSFGDRGAFLCRLN